MTNKTDKIAQLKAEYPTLRTGSDETGYTEMNSAEYEATILAWADSELARAEAETKAIADKTALLTKLGITADDLKALGL